MFYINFFLSIINMFIYHNICGVWILWSLVLNYYNIKNCCLYKVCKLVIIGTDAADDIIIQSIN